MTIKSSGFTLIELLVVVAVVGILAAVGITSYNGYILSTQKKSAENLMQQISLGQTEYYSSEGKYYTNASSCTADSTTSSLIEEKLLGNADVINDNTPYYMCIMEDSGGSDYLVKAEEKVGTCEIKMTSHGTFTRLNC